jgi:Leucine-rich repeat (LRR) protein
MSEAEVFQVGDVFLQFSADSSVTFEDGQMNVTLTTVGYDQPGIRVVDITFPTPECRVVHAYTLENRFKPHVWLDGFAENPEFQGEIRVEPGLFVADGELRYDYGARSGPRILIRKRFEPGKIDPGRFTHQTLDSGQSVDVRFVHRMHLEGAGTPIPQVLFEFTELRNLLLDGYTVEEPLDGFARLQKLELLHMRFMKMSSLPESIAKLESLETLIVTNTQLRTVPEALFSLAKLACLDLQGNELEALPKVDAAKNLRTLELKGNAFTRLPASLRQIKEVSIEAKFKPLYTDSRYRNQQPFDESLFAAASDAEFVRRFDEELALHELTADRETLLPLARKGLQFRTTKADDYSKTGNTRFGGDPDLPASMSYPVGESYAWIFIAQLNLADIAKYQDFLPRTGVLSFFVSDLEHIAETKVLYHAPRTPLLRCPPPEDAMFDQGPFIGFRATAAAAYSLPWEFDRIRAAFLPERAPRDNDAHGINVHVFTQHESPEERAAEDRGGQPNEWMILLTLGFDKNTGFCFWDAGTLSFVINKRDLAAGDFSNVAAFIESS